MPIPPGTIPHLGPIVDTSGSLLTATPDLRDAGTVSLRDKRLRRVNAAGDAWEDIPGHVISATAPPNPFEGQAWYDTGNDAVKFFNGTSFVEVTGGGGMGGVDQTARDAAAAAQTTATTADTVADAAQADIDAHEVKHPQHRPNGSHLSRQRADHGERGANQWRSRCEYLYARQRCRRAPRQIYRRRGGRSRSGSEGYCYTGQYSRHACYRIVD